MLFRSRNTASGSLKKVDSPVDPLNARNTNTGSIKSSADEPTVTAAIRRPVAGALKDKLSTTPGTTAFVYRG